MSEILNQIKIDVVVSDGDNVVTVKAGGECATIHSGGTEAPFGSLAWATYYTLCPGDVTLNNIGFAVTLVREIEQKIKRAFVIALAKAIEDADGCDDE